MICSSSSAALSFWTFPMYIQMQVIRSWNDSFCYAIQTMAEVQRDCLMFWTHMTPQDGPNSEKGSRGTIDGKHPSPLLEKMIAAAVSAQEVRWH